MNMIERVKAYLTILGNADLRCEFNSQELEEMRKIVVEYIKKDLDDYLEDLKNPSLFRNC